MWLRALNEAGIPWVDAGQGTSGLLRYEKGHHGS